MRYRARSGPKNKKRPFPGDKGKGRNGSSTPVHKTAPENTNQINATSRRPIGPESGRWGRQPKRFAPNNNGQELWKIPPSSRTGLGGNQSRFCLLAQGGPNRHGQRNCRLNHIADLLTLRCCRGNKPSEFNDFFTIAPLYHPRSDHPHDVIDLIHDRAGNRIGAHGPFAQNPVNLCHVLHQPIHLGGDRAHH